MTEQNALDQQEHEKDVPQSNVPEYGRLLTEARESKGLSVEQVASQLRLSVKQIIGLESGDPTAFASVVYTRAHLRSYARLLGLDEAKIIDLFSGSLASEDRDQKAFIRKTTSGLRPYQEETTKYGKGKGIGWVIFLVVVAIVAYMGWRYMNPSFDLQEVKQSLGFMNSSEQVPAENSAEKNKETEGAKTQASPEAVKQEPQKTPKAGDSAPAVQPQTEAAKPRTEAVKPAEPEPAAAADASKVEQPATQIVGKTPEERTLEEKVMAEHNQQIEAQKKAEEAKVNPQPAEAPKPVTLKLVQNENGWQTTLPAAKNNDPVNIKFNATDGDCWFGVYVNGKLVDNTTLKQGGAKEFNHALPFRVTVGNKFRARVFLNGNPVDLTSSSRSGSVSFQVHASE